MMTKLSCELKAKRKAEINTANSEFYHSAYVVVMGLFFVIEKYAKNNPDKLLEEMARITKEDESLYKEWQDKLKAIRKKYRHERMPKPESRK